MHSLKTYKIIIAGGGTGGHIFPAIAIANAIKKIQPATEILFIGAKNKMEMEKIPLAGFKIIGLDIAGFNRSSFLKNLSLPVKLIKSFLQVRKIVNNFKPDAAIGVGGYSSFPVLKFCQAKGIKTFIHESNSFAGKSNILLGKNATKIFVAREGMEKFFPNSKLIITGNPVRKVIAESNISQANALQYFGLSTTKKTLLVVGGSLGSKSINDAIYSGLNFFVEEKINVIWQTGKSNFSSYQTIHNTDKGIWVNEFIGAMEMAYAAADVVISRSGAMSVAELCVVKKPVIFVPFPFAAEDHQTINAMQLVKQNAALIVKDEYVQHQLVIKTIELLKNEPLQIELKNNIAKFSITNADQKIAEIILENLI